MTQTIQPLANAIEYLQPEEQHQVMCALEKAVEWHEGQYRSSGALYVEHPVAVAVYLASLKAGKETLIAALLHDVVEDERASLDDVRSLFGDSVAKLVDGVTKLSKLKYEGKRVKRQIASLRKMLLSANEDLRVIFIKLADRLHNILTISALPPDKQDRIAHETLEIYVPFARLAGLWDLKRVFETSCFPIAFPEESAEWSKHIQALRLKLDRERTSFVERINAETATDVEAHIDYMTDYEVYQKLQGQIALLKDVQSLDSINVVLTEEGKEAELNCYKLLGEVHRKYPVLADSFHDYISTPQPNGYRALHTTVFIAQNHLVKLRIQTRYMHDYNVRRKLSDWAVDPESNLRAALAALSKSPKDGSDYLEDLKSTVLEKPISIFTTLGEIISLPPDSTGVDFVYAVDPGYLRYLEGIWVNGERMEASRKLEDGDTVEPIYLVTEENGKHSMMWLNKVKSIEAREALKNAIQKDSVADVNTQARQILTQELGKERLSPTWLFRVGQLQKLVSEALGFSSFDHVLQDLGSGLLPVSRVVEAYKKVLAEPHGIFVRILSALHLLPRSRVLDNKKYLINIAIYAKDRRGLIYDITRCFAQRDINIAKFGVFAYPNGGALYHIRLEAKDFEEFSDLFDALLQVPSVTRVLRTR